MADFALQTAKSSFLVQSSIHRNKFRSTVSTQVEYLCERDGDARRKFRIKLLVSWHG